MPTAAAIWMDNDSIVAWETLSRDVKRSELVFTDSNTVILNGGEAQTAMRIRNVEEPTAPSDAATKYYVDTRPANTLAATGVGDASLVRDGTGPALQVRGLTGGTKVTVTQYADDVCIDGPDATTLTSVSTTGDVDLVAHGAGPALKVRRLTAGDRITLTQNSDDVVIAVASCGGNPVRCSTYTLTQNLQVSCEPTVSYTFPDAPLPATPVAATVHSQARTDTWLHTVTGSDDTTLTFAKALCNHRLLGVWLYPWAVGTSRMAITTMTDDNVIAVAAVDQTHRLVFTKFFVWPGVTQATPTVVAHNREKDGRVSMERLTNGRLLLITINNMSEIVEVYVSDDEMAS